LVRACLPQHAPTRRELSNAHLRISDRAFARTVTPFEAAPRAGGGGGRAARRPITSAAFWHDPARHAAARCSRDARSHRSCDGCCRRRWGAGGRDANLPHHAGAGLFARWVHAASYLRGGLLTTSRDDALRDGALRGRAGLGKAGSAVISLALIRGAFARWPLAAAEVGVGWLHDFTHPGQTSIGRSGSKQGKQGPEGALDESRTRLRTSRQPTTLMLYHEPTFGQARSRLLSAPRRLTRRALPSQLHRSLDIRVMLRAATRKRNVAPVSGAHFSRVLV